MPASASAGQVPGRTYLQLTRQPASFTYLKSKSLAFCRTPVSQIPKCHGSLVHPPRQVPMWAKSDFESNFYWSSSRCHAGSSPSPSLGSLSFEKLVSADRFGLQIKSLSSPAPSSIFSRQSAPSRTALDVFNLRARAANIWESPPTTK